VDAPSLDRVFFSAIVCAVHGVHATESSHVAPERQLGLTGYSMSLRFRRRNLPQAVVSLAAVSLIRLVAVLSSPEATYPSADPCASSLPL